MIQNHFSIIPSTRSMDKGRFTPGSFGHPPHCRATLSLPSYICQLAPEKYNNDHDNNKKIKKNDDNDNTVKGLNAGVIS